MIIENGSIATEIQHKSKVPHDHGQDSTEHKLKKYAQITLKMLVLSMCLYFFIISLNLMSTSFPLIGGRYASEAFRSNVVLTNPFAGLMIGLLATVVVQSSSTSTSIVVSMVSASIIPVKYAIPIIMGTNIGTSVTNTLVSISQVSDKERFRLSFAGATVHDMFNWLTVFVLLPIEMAFGYLEHVTGYLVSSLKASSNSGKEPEMLNVIIKPVTNAIIQIDKHVLDKIATNLSVDEPLIKRHCGIYKLDIVTENGTIINSTHSKPCSFLFANLGWPEWTVGLLLLVISLATLCGCLVLMVKILNSMFNGPVAHLMKTVVNAEFPGVFRHFTGYVAIALGCVLTILLQSSSVFTSTLTPLAGLGLITIERLFPLTLGSNIGTTITGILAALSGPSRTFQSSFQIALCHTLFNITGILVWYPIPCLRRVPINMAKWLGNTTAEYRWFAIAYTILMFIAFPIIVFIFSLLGTVVFMTVTAIVSSICLFVTVINLLQKKRPECLPVFLRDWKFLPHALRSLAPYDKFIRKYLCFMKRCQKFMVVEQTSLAPVDVKTVMNGQLSPASFDAVSMNTVDSRAQFKYINQSYASDDFI